MNKVLKEMERLAERNKLRQQLKKLAKEAPSCCGGIPLVKGRCPECGDKL